MTCSANSASPCCFHRRTHPGTMAPVKQDLAHSRPGRITTHYLASRDGDPATWTCNQVEVARLQANRIDVRRLGATPEQRFANRSPIACSRT